jgi:hypothetical protein
MKKQAKIKNEMKITNNTSAEFQTVKKRAKNKIKKMHNSQNRTNNEKLKITYLSTNWNKRNH